MPIRSTILLFAIACAVAAPARAAFQVLSWQLTNITIDSSGSLPLVHQDDITAILNPLSTTSVSQIGTNFATATYDHSWIESLAWGDFNTSFSHQMRTPELTNISISAIYIQPTEPLRVTIDGLLDYAHTPGHLDAYSFFANVRDESTMGYPLDYQISTGELYFGPASGSVPIHGEAVIQPGTTYRLRYGIQSDNISDDLNTGTMDASGYVNFSIRPVPEPGVVLLIGPIVLVVARGARGRRPVRQGC